MEMQDLLNSADDVYEIINRLKYCKRTLRVPCWEKLEKEYYPHKHRIVVDKEFWPDKGTRLRPKPVPRITYGLQKLSTRRMTQMAFSIPVERIYYTGEDDAMKEIEKAMEKIYQCCRIDTVNIKRMRKYFAGCEIATVWYAVEGKEVHTKYGFPTKYKLRCKTYSPMDGYELLPFFDEFDDMLGFGFKYKKLENEGGMDLQAEYFEFYTDNQHFIYRLNGASYDKVKQENISILKIPLSYIFRHSPIWEDQTNNNDEIELALSRESRIIDKNSAPFVQVSGKLLGKDKKDDNGSRNDDDDARKVFNVENGGSVSYVTWQQSVEAMKFFITELKKNAEEELQLPNLSMENVKGLGAISGEARKTLLTDAHLKVGDEKGDIIEFLDRECNVIKAFLGIMKPEWKSKIGSLEVEHLITPFIQNDEDAKISKINKATGGRSVASRKTGIKMLGWVKDVDKEFEDIQGEEREEAQNRLMEDVFVSGD